jgi:urocanate hydratase
MPERDGIGPPSDEWHQYQGAPTGTDIECEGWRQEAALRLLNNNLDPAVAERPEDLVVYGGVGRAARSWEAYETILAELREMTDEETLLVQSGKPVGRVRTHERAPCVLLANTNIVSKYDTYENFRELEAMNLTVMSNYTAGSWAYIGAQGVLEGTYETLAECARQHFCGSLAGRTVVSAGLGGMGGNQPLAATMNRAACLTAEVSGARIDRRIDDGYCEQRIDDVDAAIDTVWEAADAGDAHSVAVCANAVTLLERLVERDLVPNILTDMTTAHDELEGYYPVDYTAAEADALRERDPDTYVERSLDTMERHVDAMLSLQDRGAVTFAYGNNIRGKVRNRRGRDDAFDIPGFAPEYLRPLFCRGRGPFRWIALSGDPADIERTDELVKDVTDDEGLHRWIDLAEEHVEFQGLPARVCWLGYRARGETGGVDGNEVPDEVLSERAEFALRANQLVADGDLSAPLVVTRDQLDGGSIASPNEATEEMKDGSDAIADWPILNALMNCAAGADIVAVHGSAGAVGEVQSANNHVILDGTDLAAEKARQVFDADPSSAVFRHADAGYERAIEEAEQSDIHLPMREHEER